MDKTRARKKISFPKIQEEYILTEDEVERVRKAITAGRAIKCKSKSGKDLGLLIASMSDHTSFVNFPELMDDADFILEAAKISPNPLEVNNYFVQYINEILICNGAFRIELLRAIYANPNVYNYDDISSILTKLDLVEENNVLLKDVAFKAMIEEKLAESQNLPKFEGEIRDNENAKLYRKARQASIEISHKQKDNLERLLEDVNKKNKKEEGFVWNF